MKKRRLRNSHSTSLKVKTKLTRKTVAAFSAVMLITLAVLLAYSNFFSALDSKASGDYSENSEENNVDLMFFTATSTPSGTVLLEWTVNSEIGKDYYSIDRSADGYDFSPIGLVQVEGNTNSQRTYTYVDTQPLEGSNYYRLRQTDHKGWCQFFEDIPLAIVTGSASMAETNSWGAR